MAVDLQVAIEPGADLLAVAGEGDVIPRARSEDGFAGEELRAGVAVVEDELAEVGGAIGGAGDAEVIARCFFVALVAAGEEVSGDGASFVGQAVPDEEFYGIGLLEVLRNDLETAAGEVGGAGDLGRFAGDGVGRRAGEIEEHAVFIDAVETIAGNVARERPGEFIHAPVGGGFALEDSLSIGANGFARLFAPLAGDLFEEFHDRFGDLRFGLRFESGGARGPRGVATQLVLFGRGDVPFAAVGQAHGEGLREGAGGFDLQAGEGVDLVGDGGDRDVADADGLELQLALRVVVEEDGLAGVDVGLRLGFLAAQHRDRFLRPGEALFIRHSSGEFERRLAHGEVGVGVVFQILERRGDFVRQRGGEAVDGRAGGRLGFGIIGEPHVPAGALRHDADEVFIRVEQLCDLIAEAAIIVGGQRRRANVVHRVVREQHEGMAIRVPDGEDGEAGVDRTGGADRVGGEVARVHVGADGEFAEGIFAHAVGPKDPAAGGGVIGVVDDREGDLCGGEVLVGLVDRAGEEIGEDLDVVGVSIGAETAHAAGGGVAVRGGDEHAIDGDVGELVGAGLGVVEEFAREHAGIDDDERQLLLAVVEHDGAGVQGVVGLGGDDFGEAAVDDDWELRGGDVLRVSAGAQGGSGVGRIYHGGHGEHGEEQKTDGRAG